MSSQSGTRRSWASSFPSEPVLTESTLSSPETVAPVGQPRSSRASSEGDPTQERPFILLPHGSEMIKKPLRSQPTPGRMEHRLKVCLIRFALSAMPGPWGSEENEKAKCDSVYLRFRSAACGARCGTGHQPL